MDKLVFVGKNYLDHARELGDAVPEKPVLFLKPPSVLRRAAHWGDVVELTAPRERGELHYECEIVIRLGKDLRISAVSLGLDMTLRTIQAQLKKNGHPWTVGKVFHDSAVVGPEIPIAGFADFLSTPFSFSVNGDIRQHATGSQMMMKPEALLEYIQDQFPLCEGDLIYTGTPAGVGAVGPGDSGTLMWGDRSFEVRWR